MFSIVTPVYNTPIHALQDTIDSVLAQVEPRWELILVDDASTDPEVLPLLERAAAADPRVVVVARAENGHIVRASNDALAVARGEFIALLDHDDQLVPEALASMAAAIELEPEADYLYSDEDKLAEDGRLYDHFAKPDWSPERLRCQMYTCHFSVLRAALVREVGGFHEGFDGSQDHDLVLRVTERARAVVHVPEVLYHWRAVAGSAAADDGAKPYAWDAGVRAVQAHLDRCGIEATAERGDWQGVYRVRRRLHADTLVSVVIPTRGSSAMVWGSERVLVVDAVRSVLELGGHALVEVVVVHDADTPRAVLDELYAVDEHRVRLVAFREPFNFSRKCNVGALHARGEVLVFLNDDVELCSPDFLTVLCGPLSETGVGMTGAKLFFSDTSIQHAGLLIDTHEYSHPFQGVASDDPGPFTALVVNRECTGLTAACIAVRREVFDDVGGFCETLANNFNDVDLSLKIAMLGLRRVWMADAKAFHFESQTRIPNVQQWEHDTIVGRWGRLQADPFLRRASQAAGTIIERAAAARDVAAEPEADAPPSRPVTTAAGPQA